MKQNNQNVVLSVVKSPEDNLVEGLVDRTIAERYKYGLSGLEVKKVNEFLKSITKKLPNLTHAKFQLTSKGNTFYHIYLDDNKDRVNKKVSDIHILINTWKKDKAFVELYGMNPKELAYTHDLFSKFFLTEEDYFVSLHSYYFQDHLTFDGSVVSAEDLKVISPDYYPDFEDTDLFFTEFLAAKENIVVLAGDSGIGKSKFSSLALKHMIENPDEVLDLSGDNDEGNSFPVAYIKNEKILSMDTLWVNLKKYAYKYVILDDLDFFLSPRSQTVGSDIEELKNQFVSNLLSFSDGMFINNTKFIITTNRKIDDIDNALLREGRMFGVFEFSRLSYENGLEIWLKNKLKKKYFENEFVEGEEILQSKLGSTIHSYLENKGKKRKNFLKKESKADISSKYSEDKKMGFNLK